MRKGLTAHMVVRNEPFVYYAVKSIYDYVDTILLWDTGSYDAHTLEDILKCLKEDYSRKIMFKKVKIDSDELYWTAKTVAQESDINKGLVNVGTIRQQMIDATQTSHFIIVDGDEVHYRSGAKKFREIVNNWDSDIDCVYLPICWFYDFEHVIASYDAYSVVGRIFKTQNVEMNDKSPMEMHVSKVNKEVLHLSNPRAIVYGKVPAFAHFEIPLKPWRRKYNIGSINFFSAVKYKAKLPEVFQEYPKILRRFIEEHCKSGYIDNWSVDYLIKRLSAYDSVLDIGCSSGWLLKRVDTKRRIGIDICEKAIRDARASDPLAEWIIGDLRNITDLVAPGSVECVVGMDIIEHFEKDDAIKLLKDIDSIATSAIFLFVPVGYHEQTKDDKNYGNDYWETHRSIWYPQELANHGYEVWVYPDWHAMGVKDQRKAAAAAWCYKDLSKPRSKGKIHVRYRFNPVE